jgi:hypothetical protein
MQKETIFDDEVIEYLNENIGMIKRFELIDKYYLKIYMNDGSCIEAEPDYGAINFEMKS